MQIVTYYSHLNGWEHIQVHKPGIWSELQAVVAGVDAEACKTKVSRERRTLGRLFYSPKDMNAEFKTALEASGWAARHGRSFGTPRNQTDYVKARIELEVLFGKCSSEPYGLFIRHMALFMGRAIDVGIDLLPMKALRVEMPSGPPDYETALNDLRGPGRNTPAIPLVLVGVGP